MKQATAIRWDVSREDAKRIRRIVELVHKHYPGRFNHMDLSMDLTACHLNGCPLDLAALEDAGSRYDERGHFDFTHDIAGITRHMDRTTGQLTECFLPRFAAREPSPVVGKADQ